MLFASKCYQTEKTESFLIVHLKSAMEGIKNLFFVNMSGKAGVESTPVYWKIFWYFCKFSAESWYFYAFPLKMDHNGKELLTAKAAGESLDFEDVTKCFKHVCCYGGFPIWCQF